MDTPKPLHLRLEEATSGPSDGLAFAPTVSARRRGVGLTLPPRPICTYRTAWNGGEFRQHVMDISARPFAGTPDGHEQFVRRYGYDSRVTPEAHFVPDRGHWPSPPPNVWLWLQREWERNSFGTRDTFDGDATLLEQADHMATHPDERYVVAAPPAPPPVVIPPAPPATPPPPAPPALPPPPPSGLSPVAQRAAELEAMVVVVFPNPSRWPVAKWEAFLTIVLAGAKQTGLLRAALKALVQIKRQYLGESTS